MVVRSGLVVAVFAAIASPSRVAQASDPLAETLYQEGRRATQAGDWVTARQKFQESQDREPAPGTLINLAHCEESLGRLVDARAHFAAAQPLFRPGDERVTYAKQHEVELQRRIPSLVLRLAAGAPADVQVTRDGNTLAPSALGAVTPVDPGEHMIVVREPGHTDTRVIVRLSEGETREIELAMGPVAPFGANAPPSPKSGQERATPARSFMRVPPPRGMDAQGSALRTGAIASFGIGAVGLAFGIVGGLLTIDAKNTVHDDCPGQTCRDSSGTDAANRGKTWGAVSTAGFVVAGVGAAAGAAAGAALWIAAPGRPSMGLGAAPRAGGAELRWAASF